MTHWFLVVASCCSTLLVGVDSFVLPTRATTKTSNLSLDALSLSSSSSSSSSFEYALLFDCDGVILETEELHRLAYNAAFEKFQLSIDNKPVEWSVEYYDMLQNTVGGGKQKMMFHFQNTTGVFPLVGNKPAPTTLEMQKALIDDLQTYKTAQYKKLLETQAVPRPGILALMDQALQDISIAVGVCSASTKEAAQRTLALTIGPQRVQKLNVCLLGDDVAAKKPNPLIYTTAAQRIGVPPERCIVVEDSLIGLPRGNKPREYS